MAGRSGGRRLLSLEGGNRGVVAQDVVLLKCYGDFNGALCISWVSTAMNAGIDGAKGISTGG